MNNKQKSLWFHIRKMKRVESVIEKQVGFDKAYLHLQEEPEWVSHRNEAKALLRSIDPKKIDTSTEHSLIFKYKQQA